MRNPRTILITGASSGIGAALTRRYAAPGTTLVLSGCNRARLDTIAADCARRGAAVRQEVLDVRERAAMAEWIAAADQTSPLDLVIANAGISAGTGGMGESDAQATEIFAVNVDGVINTVLPAIARMQARELPTDGERRGQIAIMASVAAFRGVAAAPAYCASKAAIRVYGEGLRALLAGDGIEVCVVCPGFVRSPMTEINKFPMPFLMDADAAARIIQRGLARNRGRIIFPWPMHAAAWLLAALPTALTDHLVRRLPAKESA